jgi:pre-rRNA-processing protein TSR3
MELYVMMYRQDDPKKCTAAKLVRMSQVKPVPRRYYFSRNTVILDPYAEDLLLPGDRGWATGLAVVDCSWRLAGEVFPRRIRGVHRRLPALMAGNPTHYAVIGRLSSVEALAGSLIIMGRRDLGEKLLSYFKWGETFLTLNADALREYSEASDARTMMEVESTYFSGNREKVAV